MSRKEVCVTGDFMLELGVQVQVLAGREDALC